MRGGGNVLYIPVGNVLYRERLYRGVFYRKWLYIKKDYSSVVIEIAKFPFRISIEGFSIDACSIGEWSIAIGLYKNRV